MLLLLEQAARHSLLQGREDHVNRSLLRPRLHMDLEVLASARTHALGLAWIP